MGDDLPSVRLAALALLTKHYGSIGGPATCGPLSSNPDTDIMILGACSRVRECWGAVQRMACLPPAGSALQLWV